MCCYLQKDEPKIQIINGTFPKLTKHKILISGNCSKKTKSQKDEISILKSEDNLG